MKNRLSLNFIRARGLLGLLASSLILFGNLQAETVNQHYDAYGHPLVSAAVQGWLGFIGSPGDDSGNAVAVDADGSVYLAGESVATWGFPIRPPAGGLDGFVAKLDSHGDLLWNTFLGSAPGDSAQGIALDASGNIYVAGISNATWGNPLSAYQGLSDAYLVKLNANGGLLWQTFLGGTAKDNGYALAVGPSGEVYLSGTSTASWGNPLQPWNFSEEAFVARIDADGTYRWHTFLGIAGSTKTGSLAAGTDGRILVAGGASPAAVVCLNSSGVQQWKTELGAGSLGSGMALALDGSGNAYVTGESFSSWGQPLHPHSVTQNLWDRRDIFIASLDSNGALRWNTFMGGSCPDTGYGIAVDAASRVHVTGYSQCGWDLAGSYNGGQADSFLLRLDSQGHYQGHTFVGGVGNDWGNGLAVDGRGFVYVSGYAGMAWGNPLTAAPGGGDAFLLKYYAGPLRQPDVLLDGPSYGSVQHAQSFKASFSPASATLPITYQWAATGQSPVTHSGALEDTHSWVWNSGGPKRVTVSVTYGGATVTDSRLINITSPTSLMLTGLQKLASGVSRYQVTNIGSGPGHLQHTFYNDTLDPPAQLQTMLAAGASQVISLCDLGDLPLGYLGSVRLQADQPLQAQRLPMVTGNPPLDWSMFLGQHSRALDLAPNGVIYLTGSYNEKNFTQARDSQGGLLWNTVGFDYTGSALAYSSTQGGPVCLGETTWNHGDVYVEQFNGNGIRQWRVALGGADTDQAGAIVTAPNGDIIITGASTNGWGMPVHAAFSPYAGIFVARLSDQGILLWNTFLGVGKGHALEINAGGEIYVAGVSSNTWGNPIAPYDGNNAFFLAKLDSGGRLIWNTFYGKNADGNALALAQDGTIFATGFSKASFGNPIQAISAGPGADSFLARFSPDGTLMWSTFMGAAGQTIDSSNDVLVSGERVFVTGNSGATWGAPLAPYSGSNDAFVAEFDADGRRLWHAFLGSAEDDYGLRVFYPGDHLLYVAGWGRNSWGLTLRPHTGNKDAFLAAINLQKVLSGFELFLPLVLR